MFPDDFQEMLNGFKRAQDRAALIRSIERALEELPDEIVELSEFARSDSVKEFDEARAKLRSFFPGVVGKELRAAADRDGELSYEQQVRDFAAEERHRSKFDALSEREQRERMRAGILKKRDSKFFQMQRASAGFLSGYQLIALREPLGLILVDLMKRMTSSLSSPPSEAHRRVWLKNLKDMRERIASQRKSIELLDSFFSLENFRRIARWVDLRFQGVGELSLSSSHASWIDSEGKVSGTVEVKVRN